MSDLGLKISNTFLTNSEMLFAAKHFFGHGSAWDKRLIQKAFLKKRSAAAALA